MSLYDLTFYDVICRNAVAHRDKLAWFEAENGREVTFAQYKAMADCLARGLQDLGIGQGDRIGVLGKNSLEFFLLYGAAGALGAIMLPVNWRLPADEMAFNNVFDLGAGETFQRLVVGKAQFVVTGREGAVLLLRLLPGFAQT